MHESTFLFFNLLQQPGNFPVVIVAIIAAFALVTVATVSILMSKRTAHFSRRTENGETTFSTKHDGNRDGE